MMQIFLNENLVIKKLRDWAEFFGFMNLGGLVICFCETVRRVGRRKMDNSTNGSMRHCSSHTGFSLLST